MQLVAGLVFIVSAYNDAKSAEHVAADLACIGVTFTWELPAICESGAKRPYQMAESTA